MANKELLITQIKAAIEEATLLQSEGKAGMAILIISPEDVDPPEGSVDPGMTEVLVEETLLFDALALRSTDITSPLRLADMRDGDSIIFQVENGLDADVTVTLIGDRDESAHELAGLMGQTAIVTTLLRDPVTTSLWAPWMGLTVTANSTPTAGSITIRALVQKR